MKCKGMKKRYLDIFNKMVYVDARTLNNIEFSRWIWLKVIYRAQMDAVVYRQLMQKKRKTRTDRNRLTRVNGAIFFLFGKDSGFEDVCAALQICPEEVRKKTRKDLCKFVG